MPGTISRFALISQNFQFCTDANGTEWAVRIGEGALGDLDFSVAVRDSWDSAFKQAASYIVYSSNDEASNDWLTTGHLWDTGTPTWRALYDGTADYQGLTGMPAINKRLNDYASTHSVHDLEIATDTAWWTADVLAWAQARLESLIANYVPEQPPAPPPDPILAYPPQVIGPIQSPIGLMVAHATRLRLVNVAGHIKLQSIPVPV